MTQNTQVLMHLSTGESLTASEARLLYHIERLASRIEELKRAGHNIETVMETFTTVLGHRGRYARYKLIK